LASVNVGPPTNAAGLEVADFSAFMAGQDGIWIEGGVGFDESAGIMGVNLPIDVQIYLVPFPDGGWVNNGQGCQPLSTPTGTDASTLFMTAEGDPTNMGGTTSVPIVGGLPRTVTTGTGNPPPPGPDEVAGVVGPGDLPHIQISGPLPNPGAYSIVVDAVGWSDATTPTTVLDGWYNRGDAVCFRSNPCFVIVDPLVPVSLLAVEAAADAGDLDIIVFLENHGVDEKTVAVTVDIVDLSANPTTVSQPLGTQEVTVPGRDPGADAPGASDVTFNGALTATGNLGVRVSIPLYPPMTVPLDAEI